MKLTGLIPARFLTMIAHLVIVIVIFFSKNENIVMGLPENYSTDQYSLKDTQITVALSVTLGLFVVELVGFIGGITMFMPFQSLFSTCAHSAAAIVLSYFLFDAWPSDWYWYVFGFCSAFPAITELATIVGVLALRMGY